MKKLVIIIVLIVLVLAGYFGYRAVFKKETDGFTIYEVSKGRVVQQVSETGVVKLSDKLNLSFKNAGKIKDISFKVGDLVKEGEKIASLDSSQLYLQLSQYRAALQVAEADYANAKVSLFGSEQTLSDTKTKALQDLSNANQDAKSGIVDSYLKAYNAFNDVESIERTYFSKYDQEGITVRNESLLIEKEVSLIKGYSEKAESEIESYLPSVKGSLGNIKSSLEAIRNTIELSFYRDAVSSTDKASLDTAKLNIITEISDTNSSLQTIINTKIANEKAINSIVADVNLKASSFSGKTNLYEAKINQAKYQVQLLEEQIKDSVLTAPFDGQIIDILKRKGETALLGETILVFLPSGTFQIKADIYEEDIVKVKVGDPVEIFFVAYPDQVFKGEVYSINPSEKIVSEVVYYEISVMIKDKVEGLRSGMSADIIIETARKEDVLIIPRNMVERRGFKKIVNVFKNGSLEEREIIVGLMDSENYQLVSGLDLGDKIAVKK